MTVVCGIVHTASNSRLIDSVFVAFAYHL